MISKLIVIIQTYELYGGECIDIANGKYQLANTTSLKIKKLKRKLKRIYNGAGYKY
jgi:hypothetical protein